MKISKAKKVWILKNLLKKHRCSIQLEKDFIRKKDGSKHLVFNVVLNQEGGRSFRLIIEKNKKKYQQSGARSTYAISIPYNDFISYADVLDAILKIMKRNDSDCMMVEKSSISMSKILIFLNKGVTLEELAIEFDLTYRDFYPAKS